MRSLCLLNETRNKMAFNFALINDWRNFDFYSSNEISITIFFEDDKEQEAKISSIETKAFDDFQNLEFFILNSLNIVKIGAHSFQHLRKLKKLDEKMKFLKKKIDEAK